MKAIEISTKEEVRKKATKHLLKAILLNSLSDFTAFVEIVQKEAV